MSWFALALWFLIGAPFHHADAQFYPLGLRGQATGGYVGPGDIVSGATIWVGTRAYNATYAAATGKAIHVVGTASSGDVHVLINGDLNVSQATALSNTASCTATISGLTMTVSSCSSGTIAEIGDVISGVGITQPAYITGIGTCASPPGTCTLNASQTVSVPETVTVVRAMNVTTAYDQSGANACSGVPCASNYAGSDVYLIPQCANNKPCLVSIGTVSGFFFYTSFASSVAEPYTLTSVYQDQGSITGAIDNVVGSAGGGIFSTNANPNDVEFYLGTAALIAATDLVTHDVEGKLNGASTVASVDGAQSTISPGTVGSVTEFGFGVDSSHSFFFQGFLMEGGLWPTGFSSGNFTSMHNNVCAYWGTSC